MPSEKNIASPERKHHRLAQFRRWHKWVGLAAGLFLLITATSGIVLNYKRPIFAALGVESDAKEGKIARDKSRPTESGDSQMPFTTAGGFSNTTVSLEQALALAREHWGDVPLERIEMRAERSALLYRIKARSGEELQVNATTGANFFKGGYERVKTASDGTAMVRTTDWGKIILDLHTGKIGGETGKIVMSLAALMLMFLTASGVYMWLKPVFIRRQNSRARSVAVADAAAIANSR